MKIIYTFPSLPMLKQVVSSALNITEYTSPLWADQEPIQSPLRVSKAKNEHYKSNQYAKNVSQHKYRKVYIFKGILMRGQLVTNGYFLRTVSSLPHVRTYEGTPAM